MTKRVDQRNAQAGGDIAGGDITKVIYERPKTRLEVMVSNLQRDVEQDSDAKEFIASLQRWTVKSTEYRRNLEQKLTACGKENLIKDATAAKEAFAKQLLRTTFRSALQEVYAHILQLVWSKFTHEIKPKIAADASADTELAICQLATEIDQQLANAPPELGLSVQEVLGMLYYLTGNCHIDWD